MTSSKKQHRIGWQGFRPDPDKYTTYTVVIAAVNIFLLILALDTLLEIGKSGEASVKQSPLAAVFYIKCAVVMISSAITAALIQYKDLSARWGARAIACGLPFFLASLMVVNAV